jgi:hypothetical protein
MEARISNPPQGMKRLLINILVRALSTINAYPTGLTDEREVLALPIRGKRGSSQIRL